MCMLHVKEFVFQPWCYPLSQETEAELLLFKQHIHPQKAQTELSINVT